MSDDRRKEVSDKAAQLLTLDFFSLLGVTRTSSADDVVRAFTLAAKTWHPDRVPAGLEDLAPIFMQVFARLDEARSTLSDASRRLKYASEIGKGGAAGAKTGPSASSGSAAGNAEAALEFKKCEIVMKRNDFATAEQHLRRALQLDPVNVDYQALLIWFVARSPSLDKERLRELALDLGRLLQKNDQCERAYFYRAQIRKRLDLVVEANADYARAAELNPHNLEAASEVRLHQMRKEKKNAPAADAGGIGGFFKKLIKR